jgi:hypothetical protein
MWPNTLIVEPAPQAGILELVYVWVRQNAPPICTFVPQRLRDSRIDSRNEEIYHSLARFLVANDMVSLRNIPPTFSVVLMKSIISVISLCSLCMANFRLTRLLSLLGEPIPETAIPVQASSFILHQSLRSYWRARSCLHCHSPTSSMVLTSARRLRLQCRRHLRWCFHQDLSLRHPYQARTASSLPVVRVDSICLSPVRVRNSTSTFNILGSSNMSCTKQLPVITALPVLVVRTTMDMDMWCLRSSKYHHPHYLTRVCRRRLSNHNGYSVVTVEMGTGIFFLITSLLHSIRVQWVVVPIVSHSFPINGESPCKSYYYYLFCLADTTVHTPSSFTGSPYDQSPS